MVPKTSRHGAQDLPRPPSWSQDGPKTPQVGAKLIPRYSKDPTSWSPNEPQTPNWKPRWHPNVPQTPHLEPRWFPAPPTWSPDGHKMEIVNLPHPDLGGGWGPTWPPDLPKISTRWVPKATPKRSKISTLVDHVFDELWNRFLIIFGANLDPKILPNLSKVGANIEPRTSLCIDFGIGF